MIRVIEGRLRRLEADAPAKRVRYVFSATCDPVEWERAIAEMIASGRAREDDAFVRIGWMPSA